MDSFALAACYKPVSVLNPPTSEFREHVHGHSRTVLFFFQYWGCAYTLEFLCFQFSFYELLCSFTSSQSDLSMAPVCVLSLRKKAVSNHLGIEIPEEIMLNRATEL